MIKRIYWTDDIRIDNPFLRKKLFPLELVPEDDITVIVGKNGSGKTRLLSSIEQLCKIETQLKKQNLPKFERRSLLQDKERLQINIEMENNEEMPVYVMKQDSILHSKTPFVSAVTPLALPRGGADIRIVRQCHTRSVML